MAHGSDKYRFCNRVTLYRHCNALRTDSRILFVSLVFMGSRADRVDARAKLFGKSGSGDVRNPTWRSRFRSCFLTAFKTEFAFSYTCIGISADIL